MSSFSAPNEDLFLTTQWTNILSPGEESSSTVSQALTSLCEIYYRPVYAFIKHRYRDPEEARDLCQGFFEFLIEKNIHRNATPERGRFRAFLLTSVKNHLKQQHRSSQALKRGGGKPHISLEFADLEEEFPPELLSDIPSDTLFDIQWASAVFDQTWDLLRKEYELLDQVDRFEILRPTITNPNETFPYAEFALQLNLSESGVKSAAFRMKGRFRELFRECVSQIVDSPGEVDQEIEYLIQAMAQYPVH